MNTSEMAEFESETDSEENFVSLEDLPIEKEQPVCAKPGIDVGNHHAVIREMHAYGCTGGYTGEGTVLVVKHGPDENKQIVNINLATGEITSQNAVAVSIKRHISTMQFSDGTQLIYNAATGTIQFRSYSEGSSQGAPRVNNGMQNIVPSERSATHLPGRASESTSQPGDHQLSLGQLVLKNADSQFKGPFVAPLLKTTVFSSPSADSRETSRREPNRPAEPSLGDEIKRKLSHPSRESSSVISQIADSLNNTREIRNGRLTNESPLPSADSRQTSRREPNRPAEPSLVDEIKRRLSQPPRENSSVIWQIADSLNNTREIRNGRLTNESPLPSADSRQTSRWEPSRKTELSPDEISRRLPHSSRGNSSIISQIVESLSNDRSVRNRRSTNEPILFDGIDPKLINPRPDKLESVFVSAPVEESNEGYSSTSEPLAPVEGPAQHVIPSVVADHTIGGFKPISGTESATQNTEEEKNTDSILTSKKEFLLKLAGGRQSDSMEGEASAINQSAAFNTLNAKSIAEVMSNDIGRDGNVTPESMRTLQLYFKLAGKADGEGGQAQFMRTVQLSLQMRGLYALHAAGTVNEQGVTSHRLVITDKNGTQVGEATFNSY